MCHDSFCTYLAALILTFPSGVRSSFPALIFGSGLGPPLLCVVFFTPCGPAAAAAALGLLAAEIRTLPSAVLSAALAEIFGLVLVAMGLGPGLFAGGDFAV